MTAFSTATEAIARIPSGSRIFIHGGAATPTPLLEALAARALAGDVRDITTVSLHIEGPGPHLAKELSGIIRHRALFIGGNARTAVREGRADYVPVFLSDIPALFRRGSEPLDVAFINVSPPDAHGFCSLGVSVDVALAAVRAAKHVIALVNPQMPRTHGDGFIHVSALHALVAGDQAPYELASPELSAEERRIGAHIAGLVPDGATLQLGIGSIPAAVGLELRGKKDLGVHTEMFTDTVLDLIEAGAITGQAKEVNRGKVVTAFAMGTARLYRFIDDNPIFEFRPADYTNDTQIIRRFRKMVAVNSAIEVDLSGQVCADSIGTACYSGVGGQMDFIRGAALADEGRGVIALPSTAKGGTVSRIVPTLRPGAGVVTTRAHIHTVVTEHGIAELHGKSVRERVMALSAIAAPEFRDELRAAARAQGWL
jgi:4-hydroxybutyrate CoA-transferase